MLVIPEDAIGTDQDRKFVLVLKPDSSSVDYRPVNLGRLVDGAAHRPQGLKPGEQVVVNGLAAGPAGDEGQGDPR